MNVFLETLWFLLLFCYYTLEATVLFFVPSRYRRKDVKGQIVLITGAGAYLLTTGVALVAWHSGRTSLFGRRTFSVLRSTCI